MKLIKSIRVKRVYVKLYHEESGNYVIYANTTLRRVLLGQTEDTALGALNGEVDYIKALLELPEYKSGQRKFD